MYALAKTDYLELRSHPLSRELIGLVPRGEVQNFPSRYLQDQSASSYIAAQTIANFRLGNPNCLFARGLPGRAAPSQTAFAWLRVARSSRLSGERTQGTRMMTRCYVATEFTRVVIEGNKRVVLSRAKTLFCSDRTIMQLTGGGVYPQMYVPRLCRRRAGCRATRRQHLASETVEERMPSPSSLRSSRRR